MTTEEAQVQEPQRIQLSIVAARGRGKARTRAACPPPSDLAASRLIEAARAELRGKDLREANAALRMDLTALANSAVDGIVRGHVFYPHRMEEPPPLRHRPLTQVEIDGMRDVGGNSELIDRLIATVEQRNRIFAAMWTDANPAGTAREVVELRDLVAALIAKVAEMKADAADSDAGASPDEEG